MSQIYAFRRVALSMALFAIVALGAASTARADSVILNISQGNGSSLPNQNYGTITLTTNGGNIDVVVSLNFGARIINGGQDCSLCFRSSVSPNPNPLSFSNFNVAGYAGINGGVPATLHADGYGNFEYGVNYTGGGGGNCGVNSPPCVGNLSFTISRSGGFSSVNELLEASTGGGLSAPWALDIVCTNCPEGSTGQTGFVGAFPQPPGREGGEVPEPASMLLLGTGLIGVAAGARRRLRKK